MAGSKGRIPFYSDFNGSYASVVWGATQLVSGDTFGTGIGFTSVNEGSFASVVDEPGGILSVTTDTADNDNSCFISGPYRPADGVMFVEARFKYAATDNAFFVGFSETMALDTPVMPAEFATATMTYNGTGGMVGWQFDEDGTTDDWRAVMGDGGAAVSGSGNGTRAMSTPTTDSWVICRVVMYEDTSAECWIGEVGHADSNSIPTLRLVKKFDAGLTATDNFYAVVMQENRAAGANVWEIDYIDGEAGRDWRTT